MHDDSTRTASPPTASGEGLTIRVDVRGDHDVVLARRAARRVAKAMGLSETRIAAVMTAASELATNLVQHAASGGSIVVEGTRRDGKECLGISAVDEGPGIVDIDLAMQEGYSSSGGLGGGLPAVGRLMDEISVVSSPEEGTQVVARKWI